MRRSRNNSFSFFSEFDDEELTLIAEFDEEEHSPEEIPPSPGKIIDLVMRYGYEAILERNRSNQEMLVSATKATINMPWLYFLSYFAEYEKQQKHFLCGSQSSENANWLLEQCSHCTSQDAFKEQALAVLEHLYSNTHKPN